MKIGFSFGRCVRDIVLGEVPIEDVLLIISRTRIDSRQIVVPVIEQYLQTPDYLMGLDRDKCVDVAYQLWDTARLHQPRLMGIQTFHVLEKHVWCDIIPSLDIDDNDVIKQKYEELMVLAKLSLTEQPKTPHNLELAKEFFKKSKVRK